MKLSLPSPYPFRQSKITIFREFPFLATHLSTELQWQSNRVDALKMKSKVSAFNYSVQCAPLAPQVDEFESVYLISARAFKFELIFCECNALYTIGMHLIDMWQFNQKLSCRVMQFICNRYRLTYVSN